jgi:putative nucleotidyltransferase with HDIG domain
LGRLGGFRIPVGYRIVFPFTALCLLLGVFVSAMASQQLGAAAATRLDREAMREQYSVGAAFASFEQRRLTVLRTLSTLDGVPQALDRRDVAALKQSLYPVVANQLPDALTVSVVSAQSGELLRMSPDISRPTRCECGAGGGAADLPYVGDVLAGVQDDQGPKFAAASQIDGAWYAYVVGPVLAGARVAGAIVVAERLDNLVAELRASDGIDLALYAPDGSLMAASPGLLAAPGLSVSQRQLALGGGTVRQRAGQAQLFYVPLMLRGRSAGYTAIAVPDDAVSSASGEITPLLIAIFALALGLTLLVGAAVARTITRPLSLLVEASDRVAAGNLDTRALVSSNDEIGRLASSFNLMTRSLAEKTTRLEANAEAVLQTLAAAIDARDAYTHGHSIRVAAYSAEIGRRLGLPEKTVESIRRGCLIHDIGKIGVADQILRKPDRLSYQEEVQMRRHPADGYEIVRNLDWPEEVLQVVRHHHERWDGRGYPDRLEGTRVPLAARIVAVADALDAMTSQRPYRLALTFSQAHQAIGGGAGAQFDPAVVAAFMQSARHLRSMVEAESRPSLPMLLRSAG